MNNRPGRIFWIILVLLVIGAPSAWWFNKWFQTGTSSAKKLPETNRHVRAVLVDFRNILPKDRAITDLKGARPDLVMVWGLGRKDFEKLAADMGMVHYSYSRSGCGVLSRWRLARPKAVGGGIIAEQTVAGRIYGVQCGVSQAPESGMAIAAAENNLDGFESVLRLKANVVLGVAGNWDIHGKGELPSGQGGWIEIGWK